MRGCRGGTATPGLAPAGRGRAAQRIAGRPENTLRWRLFRFQLIHQLGSGPELFLQHSNAKSQLL